MDTPGEQGDVSGPSIASGAPVLLGLGAVGRSEGVWCKMEGKGTGQGTGAMGQGRDQRSRTCPKESAQSLAQDGDVLCWGWEKD